MEPRLAARLQQQLAKEAATVCHRDAAATVPSVADSAQPKSQSEPPPQKEESRPSPASTVVYAPTQARAIFKQNDTSERSCSLSLDCALMV